MKTIALVTIFNPNIQVKDNILILSKQVDYVILCDNSKNDNSTMFDNIKNSIYIFNNKNLGLSAAFNKAFLDYSSLFEDNDFIIFFDQDSIIANQYIYNLKNEYIKIENAGFNIGCLGASYADVSDGKPQIPRIKKQLFDGVYKVPNIITSSMLTRFKILKDVNFWNEKIFLDLADWDLCWRINEKGYFTCLTTNVIFNHHLGLGSIKKGLVKLKKGSPFREYYQTRDSLYLLEEKYVPLKPRLSLTIRLLIRPFIHYIFLDDKKERMYYIKKGHKDYRKKIYGSLNL